MPTQVRLLNLVPHERTALAALMGAATRATNSFTLHVPTVDAMLVEAGLASSLRDALEKLDGQIVNRAALADEQRAGWAAVFEGVNNHSLSSWLTGTLNRGLVKRYSGARTQVAAQILSRVELVLRSLPANGMTRSQLAAATLGDAHALDSGRPESSIVLAVLRHARRASDEEQDIEEDRRETWATAGVLINELARPALFLNLPVFPSEQSVGRRHLGTLGEPGFISLRRLLRSMPAWNVAERDVFVCENPNIVAIAADQLGHDCAPLVCTDGMPSAAQRTLLSQLAAAGARLWYHGDFDWPGIGIANLVIREHLARPWRMSACDYVSAIETVTTRVPLSGVSVTASWDEELSAQMMELNVRVAEEALAARMLIDLQDTALSAPL
ncbi:MAG: TIGR02679 family protein [Moraxellaceae bacterium]|nr:TIGR02679 family protein [Moraxellaceae bacterium]